MVRIGISIYLMLATLAGPWLCCCTPTRLLASLAHSGKAGQSQPCCRHHPSAAGEQHTGPKKSPRNQKQSGHPACPWQENRSEPVGFFSPDSESAKQLQPRYFPCSLKDGSGVLPTIAMLYVEGTTKLPQEPGALPFLTAQDILRSLHIMRC